MRVMRHGKEVARIVLLGPYVVVGRLENSRENQFQLKSTLVFPQRRPIMWMSDAKWVPCCLV
jgi:hypothetical protein